MNRPTLPSRPDPTQFATHVDGLRVRLQAITNEVPLEKLAERTGSTMLKNAPESGLFSLQLWGQPILITYPNWLAYDAMTGNSLSTAAQALLLYYFLSADGAIETTRWISFADLPDGRFYNQAFQGYTGVEIARSFRNDLARFAACAEQRAGQRLGPNPQIPGDLAYQFQALPRLSVLVVYWQGDEDFPASARVLFEAVTPHYLPTDVCAYLGSTITRKLLQP